MIEHVKTFSARMTRTVSLEYLLNLPDGYGQADRKWPLILFLHGAGERGRDINNIRVHGIPKLVMNKRDFPFITLSPQCPENYWWSDYLDVLVAMIDQTIADYRVDESRIYVTGLSMGGFGTWHLAAEYPERFAAIVPICGGGLWAYGFPERAAVLKDMPVWAFHGGKDDVVPVEASSALVDVLKEHGGNVRFTVYPDAGHDSWTETYNNSDVYAWLLEQRLPVAGDEAENGQ